MCKGCFCLDCCNNPENLEDDPKRREEQARIRARNPLAPAPKDEAAPFEGQSVRPGCRCRKSRCVKKYCECYDGGRRCSGACRCIECANEAPKKEPPLGGGSGVAAHDAADEEEEDALGSLASAAGLAFGLPDEKQRALTPRLLAAVAPYHGHADRSREPGGGGLPVAASVAQQAAGTVSGPPEQEDAHVLLRLPPRAPSGTKRPSDNGQPSDNAEAQIKLHHISSSGFWFPPQKRMMIFSPTSSALDEDAPVAADPTRSLSETTRYPSQFYKERAAEPQHESADVVAYELSSQHVAKRGPILSTQIPSWAAAAATVAAAAAFADNVFADPPPLVATTFEGSSSCLLPTPVVEDLGFGDRSWSFLGSLPSVTS